MSEAAVLKCPECGGAVGAGERRCHHCRAELLTVRCSACFRLHHAGATLCTQCGHTLGLEAQLGPLDIACPRCAGETLEGIRLEGHDLGECRKCGGLFVDHAVLEKATRSAEARRGFRLRAEEQKETEARAQTASTSFYIRCPHCKEQMSRRNFGRVSGVLIDVCNAHGIWFDRDELSHIIEFVETYGLSRDISGAPKRKLLDAGPRVNASELESYDAAGTFFRALLNEVVDGVLRPRRRWW